MALLSSDTALQVKTLFKSMSAAKIASLIMVVAGAIIGFVFIMNWSGRQDYQYLYSNLSPEDAGEVLSRLKEQKIPYELTANGGSIMIPSDKVYETRLEMASQGLPRGGDVGFEVFDDTKIGMTEFVQNVNYQRALQGELSRTINKFAEVESSRVHIVLPKRQLFIDDEEPTTASVILKLRKGRGLSKSQIQGIVHLVSSSVSRLSPERVTVVDSSGQLLAGRQDQDGVTLLSSDQLEYQEKVERNLENRLESMLESALGPGKAVVRVSCTFDFMQHEQTEEMYVPENSVVRSEEVSYEVSSRAENLPSGVPGLASFRGGAGEGLPETPNNLANQNQDKRTNYEIGKIVSRKIMPVGSILRKSVAVIVDGTYETAAPAKGAKGGKAPPKYTPRSEAEMAKLENIVKRAINFDDEKGDEVEVVNMPFESSKALSEEEEVEPRGWLTRATDMLPSLSKYLLPSLFLLLAFLFVARPLMQWMTSITVSEAEIFEQLPKTIAEIEREYAQRERMQEVGSLPYRDKATQMIASDRRSTKSAIDGWLGEK
jgi:flagellar M-ring protein FliF